MHISFLDDREFQQIMFFSNLFSQKFMLCLQMLLILRGHFLMSCHSILLRLWILPCISKIFLKGCAPKHILQTGSLLAARHPQVHPRVPAPQLFEELTNQQIPKEQSVVSGCSPVLIMLFIHLNLLFNQECPI